MTPSPPRVVLDTVVLVQALISGRGPSAACLECANAGEFLLFQNDALIAELRDVPLRPELTRRYPFLTAARIDAFVRDVLSLSIKISSPPCGFTLPRDPKDEPLIDLAVAAGAAHLVTWNDRHLTYLMRHDTPEGVDFCRRFPNLQIVAPPTFLQFLRRTI